jgi:hypothetical protein
MARLRFVAEEGAVRAEYTAKDPASVYTYDCVATSDNAEDDWDIACREAVDVAAWCRSLEVHEEGSCTAERIVELGAEGLDAAELERGVAMGREEVAQQRALGPEVFQRFTLINNNLGNKLQGRLQLKLPDDDCRLGLSDNYFVIYNGKGMVDSNPVGTNPFVPLDEGDWMWTSCDTVNAITAWDTATVPDDPAEYARCTNPRSPCTYELGTEVAFHYLGDQATDGEGECTYAMDVYAGWQSIARDVVVSPDAEGDLDWNTRHTFDPGGDYTQLWDGRPSSMYGVARWKQCGQVREPIDVACTVVMFE